VANSSPPPPYIHKTGGKFAGWTIRGVDNPGGGQSRGWKILGGQTVGGENNHES